ncbi:MAG: MBOAT family protein [Desulfobacterales bacterium]|nr:MBOAT family protein [Desulfobacterales bacterium]
MVFSSIIFLFFFLPIVLTLCFIIPKSFKNIFLFAVSLIFYAWGEIFYVWIMFFSITVNYIFGILLDNSNEISKRKALLIGAVFLNLLILGVFKYLNFFVDNLNVLLSVIGSNPINIDKIHLPIGISFFTFQALSYIVDIYRKESSAQKKFINVGLYISLFPQLIAGPIVRYNHIEKQINDRIITIEGFALGIRRFIMGLGKKVLIANTVAFAGDNIFSLNDHSFALAWTGIICYTLQIYFDFSGYSDMAIGLGLMFGFNFPENFLYPYSANSIRDFWRRWHISLSTWFRDYLYIPIGGNKQSQIRTYFNLLIVFFLCGLWHGASWTFVVWGLFHGFFLVIERIFLEQKLKKLWFPLSNLYAIFIVMIGWVFFRSDTLKYSLKYIKALMGLSLNPNLDSIWIYVNNATLLSIIAGIIFSIEIPSEFKSKIKNHIRLFKGYDAFIQPSMIFVSSILLIGVFILSSMSLASGTYNPFIYFRF